MKKLIILLSFVALAQSCVLYSDKNQDEDPREATYEYLQRDLMGSVYRTIEIADFFDRYQAIRENRDAAVVLGRLYFGDAFREDYLVYEGYDGGYWGRITPTSIPGTYQVIPQYAAPDETIYTVEVTPERKFIIRSKASTKALPPSYWIEESDIELECTASISNDNIIIENLDLKYSEDTGKMVTEVRITSTSDPAMVHACREGSWEKAPFSGILYYEIGNKMFRDAFSVKFYNGRYEIL